MARLPGYYLPGARARRLGLQGLASAFFFLELSGCATNPPAASLSSPSPVATAQTPLGDASAAPADASAAAAVPDRAESGSEIRTLAPYRVQDNPVQSFGFTVAIFGDPNTHRITSMTVESVWPDGPGGRAGLRPGTAILKINGKPVQEFAASLERGSELNRLLMNRRGGERVRLQIVRGSDDPEEVVVVEGGGAIPGISGL